MALVGTAQPKHPRNLPRNHTSLVASGYEINTARRHLPQPRNETAITLGVLMRTFPSEDGSHLVLSAASLSFRHSLFLMGETG
jgi:hypothetical protein